MTNFVRIFLVITALLCVATPPAHGRAAMPAHPDAASNDLALPPTMENAASVNLAAPVDTFWVLHTGQVGASFTNRGQFGMGFVSFPICDGEVCPSFESPEESDIEYLFGGAVWVGGIIGDDTLVTVAADGWYYDAGEMTAFLPGSDFGDVSDRSVWTLCTDTVVDPAYVPSDPYDQRPHLPLQIRIANRAHTWTSDPEYNMVIYDMVITNIGTDVIEDGYVGFYFDADVYHASNQSSGWGDDVTGSLRDNGVAYIIDNDGDPVGGQFGVTSPTKLFAFKFLAASMPLTDTAYNWWINNSTASLDFGPQPDDPSRFCNFGGAHLGTPTGDKSKYCVLSHALWDYDQIYSGRTTPGWLPPPAYAADFVDGHDTKFLMSAGPFDLAPDSSIRILYTTFTGESVHHVVGNMSNLPDDPDAYLANLDFSHVIANAAVADSLAEYLVDPANPVMGVYSQYTCVDSTVIEWDPWVFPGVEGYEIYRYEIPRDSLPYPGVAPPWIRPTAWDNTTTVPLVFRHRFDDFTPYRAYLVSMANRAARAIGRLSEPVIVQAGGKPPAPIVDNNYSFTSPGLPAMVSWSEPPGVDVDYYNVYKFPNPVAAKNKYAPLYDKGESRQTVFPKDSFFVDGQWYYYYAMEPYRQLDSGLTSFMDYTTDSTVYVVTAVSTSGLESEFSPDVLVLTAPPRTKDILVVTCANRTTDWVECDTMVAFYDSILAGYDYDLYLLRDTMQAYGCKPNWSYDLLPYRLVIIDGGLRHDPFNDDGPHYCGTFPGFEQYLHSGGTLAYFGSLGKFTGANMASATPKYYFIQNELARQLLGIDSVFTMGLMYYYNTGSPPFTDPLIGMTDADAMSGLPDVAFDLLRRPCKPGVYGMWPTNTAPSPSTFSVNANGEAIYNLRSLYPSTSLVENHPIGVRAQTDNTTAYVFGFHLWYMRHADARVLVDYLLSQTGTYATGATIIEPDSLDFLSAYALEPKSAAIYVGALSGGYTANDIDPATIRINRVVEPVSIEVIDAYPGFEGTVMAMTVPLHDFILTYSPLWGTKSYPYQVSASLFDGTEVSAFGDVVISGFLPGDVNADNHVNISDAVYLLSYLFREGPPPVSLPVGDVDGSGAIDIGDAVYLINYIFRDGPAPIGGN